MRNARVGNQDQESMENRYPKDVLAFVEIKHHLSRTLDI